jgi:DNA polymerase I
MKTPYDLVTIEDGKVIVDDVDLTYKPSIHHSPWKPSKKLRPYDQLRITCIDIETSGLDPDKDRIYAIGLLDGDKPVIFTHLDEKRLLKEAIQYLLSHRPQMLVGHNHFAFDLPFIIKRCRHWDIHNYPFRIDPPDYIARITSASVNGQPIQFRHVRWDGVAIVDTYHQAGIYDKQRAILPNYRLKDVAIAIGARDERRLELDVHQINDCWKRYDLEPIKEYLTYDLLDTRALADFFIPQAYYQKYVVDLPLQKLAVASPAKKWQKVLEDHYGRSPQPDDSVRYEGGYCSVNPGLYKNAFKIDVSSMYPSIQLTYGICSRKDKHRHYLSVLDYLRTERYRLKKLMEKAKELFDETGSQVHKSDYELYDAQQNAYKVLINGYGFNCYPTAALVTAYGRKLIRLMIDVAEQNGGHIIEVDTDGIILVGDDPQFIFSKVQDALPEGIDIDLDWTDTHIYAPKIKNYVLIRDGKVKSKGVFRKRNRSQMQREFPIKYIQAYLDSSWEAGKVYSQIRKQIESGDCGLSYISNTERIRKGDRALTGAGLGQEGDKVTYYNAEQLRFHKRTSKPLKSSKRPVSMDSNEPYWIYYYLHELDKMKNEIDGVVNTQSEGIAA